jgi:hypothetical protein
MGLPISVFRVDSLPIRMDQPPTELSNVHPKILINDESEVSALILRFKSEKNRTEIRR